MQERVSVGGPSAGSSGNVSGYNPTRRTALILTGEGTSVAYLVGALKALSESGVRIDLVVGKGVGGLVAVLAALRAVDKLHKRDGLISSLSKRRPWRFRTPYLAVFLCLAAAFGVFVSPAVLGLLFLLVLPLLAAVRIVLPTTVDTLYRGVQAYMTGFAVELDPIYLRAMAFPLAFLFAFLLVGWILPAFFRRREVGRGPARWLGQSLIEIGPLREILEKSLWESVRGASTDPKPGRTRDIGIRYRDLLTASLGQHGFSELIFYALDIDTGQEVPFVLLKERWLARMRSRGPAQGAIAAEPMNLADEAGALLFDALIASLSPALLAPSVPLHLPLSCRYGGEVHHFASSLSIGQSSVSDAVAAGAQQIIYVSGAPASGDARAGTLEKLMDASVRQMLEADLRWAERHSCETALFVVRPDKPRLGALEFGGRALASGDRLEIGALAAQGERDMSRLFIQPLVGGGTGFPRERDTEPLIEEGFRQKEETWADGPQEL